MQPGQEPRHLHQTRSPMAARPTEAQWLQGNISLGVRPGQCTIRDMLNWVEACTEYLQTFTRLSDNVTVTVRLCQGHKSSSTLQYVHVCGCGWLVPSQCKNQDHQGCCRRALWGVPGPVISTKVPHSKDATHARMLQEEEEGPDAVSMMADA